MPRLIGLFAALFFAFPVYAEDPSAEEIPAETQSTETPAPPIEEESSFFTGLDNAFGAHVVAPIGAFLFWDVVFWSIDMLSSITS